MMPTICAIILDYFGSSKTITCLTSLLDQGLDSVVVVDNSGNHQANIQLQDALTEFRLRELPFTIHQIVNPKNLGYGAGVNNALRWLENNHPHRYYLLINNDAEATPGMLQELLKSMKQNERCVLCAPAIDIGENMIPCYWYQCFTGLMFAHHVIGTFQYLSGCCLLADQRIVRDGLFDEDFFMYGEDVELSWRLLLSGRKITCVPQATVRHKGTGSSFKGETFYEYHLMRGHLLLARKLARHTWQIPLFYFGRLLALSVRALVRTVRFQSVVPIKAGLLALYRDVQNKRTGMQ